MANKAYLLVIRYAYQKNTPILVGSLVLLLLSFYAPILWATTPTTDQPGQPLANFYVFQIPTDNQTVVDREKQIREAFQRMLVTLSGTSEILQKPRVVSVLKQVDNFVSQFTYEGFGKDATQPKTLKVTFSEKATNNLIKALGYHLWNAPRVDTLVWLALEKEDEKYWVNAETEANMWSTVQQALGNIRVPMVSPLFDLMDETEFSVGAAWQKKFVTVPAMMQRYGVDSCLLGLLREHPGGWHAEWFLFARSVTNVLQQGWQVSRMELPDLLQNSVDHLGVSLAKGVSGKALVSADSTEVVEALEPIIAAETVPPKNSEEGTQIAISGIQNSTQYAEVLSYLKNLSAGVQVEIVRIAPEDTVFRVRPAIEKEACLRKMYQDVLLVEDTRIRSQDTISIVTDQGSVTEVPDPTIYIKLIEVEKL